MVNVDVSPSVILGVGLIGSGVSLWQIRQTKPWISKDYDVVISCISLLVGGILIFQGWRLDPLLLFGQLMTTGAALSFAVEALRLRNEVFQNDEREALGEAFRFREDAGGRGQGFEQPQRLPPPEIGYQQYGYYDREESYDNNRDENYSGEDYDGSSYYYQDDDVRVYDTTIGSAEEAVPGDDADYDADYGNDSGENYGFGSIGYRRGEIDDDTEAFYNRGSRRPYSNLGDNDDF